LPTFDLASGEGGRIRRQTGHLDVAEGGPDIRMKPVGIEQVDLADGARQAVFVDLAFQFELRRRAAGSTGDAVDLALEVVDARAEGQGQRQVGKIHLAGRHLDGVDGHQEGLLGSFRQRLGRRLGGRHGGTRLGWRRRFHDLLEVGGLVLVDDEFQAQALGLEGADVDAFRGGLELFGGEAVPGKKAVAADRFVEQQIVDGNAAGVSDAGRIVERATTGQAPGAEHQMGVLAEVGLHRREVEVGELQLQMGRGRRRHDLAIGLERTALADAQAKLHRQGGLEVFADALHRGVHVDQIQLHGRTDRLIANIDGELAQIDGIDLEFPGRTGVLVGRLGLGRGSRRSGLDRRRGHGKGLQQSQTAVGGAYHAGLAVAEQHLAHPRLTRGQVDADILHSKTAQCRQGFGTGCTAQAQPAERDAGLLKTRLRLARADLGVSLETDLDASDFGTERRDERGIGIAQRDVIEVEALQIDAPGFLGGALPGFGVRGWCDLAATGFKAAGRIRLGHAGRIGGRGCPAFQPILNRQAAIGAPGQVELAFIDDDLRNEQFAFVQIEAGRAEFDPAQGHGRLRGGDTAQRQVVDPRRQLVDLQGQMFVGIPGAVTQGQSRLAGRRRHVQVVLQVRPDLVQKQIVDGEIAGRHHRIQAQLALPAHLRANARARRQGVIALVIGQR
jgi:hypothetical protein